MLRPMSLPACRMERVEPRSNTPSSQNTSMLSTLRVPADVSSFSRGRWTCRMSAVASATVLPLGNRHMVNFQGVILKWDYFEEVEVHTWVLHGLHSRLTICWWAVCVWPPLSPPASWVQSAAPDHIHSYTPPAWCQLAASGPACCRGTPATLQSGQLGCAPPWSGSLHPPGGRPCRWHLPASRTRSFSSKLLLDQWKYSQKQESKDIYLHCKFMNSVTCPDWMSVGINQTWKYFLITDLMFASATMVFKDPETNSWYSPGNTHIPVASITLSKDASEYWALMSSAGPTALISPSLEGEMCALNVNIQLEVSLQADKEGCSRDL